MPPDDMAQAEGVGDAIDEEETDRRWDKNRVETFSDATLTRPPAAVNG
jgi:hypothetical protein